nr:immunoglobulin heavy chain junction region [Mus musculus]
CARYDYDGVLYYFDYW